MSTHARVATVSLSPSPSDSANSTAGADRRRRRAQLLISRLNRLADSYPEFRRSLDGAIEDLQTQTNRTPESDRALILSAIHLGAWTVDELLDEVGFSRPETQTILDELLAANVIFVSQRNEGDRLGGRPKKLYMPAPTAPLTAPK